MGHQAKRWHLSDYLQLAFIMPRGRREHAPRAQVFAYCCDRCSVVLAASLSGRRMEYKRFIISAFEQGPGRWRASVRRANGKPLLARKRTRLEQFITDSDSPSADVAMMMAMEAIDVGTFSRRTARSTEKFWRRAGDLAVDCGGETG
jgi:hypothetical protein